MEMKTAIGDFDSYFVFLAQDRVARKVSVIGPEGQVSLADILPLVEFMNEKILEGSP